MTLTPHMIRRTEIDEAGPALVPRGRRDLALRVRGAAARGAAAPPPAAAAEPPRVEPIRPPSGTPNPNPPSNP